MDVLLERCAGIDIGKNEEVACVRTPGPGGKGRTKQTRTFLSFTGDVEAMADWFAAEGVTDVVMEATGSYWKPVWYVLEERAFELKLVNAAHVKIPEPPDACGPVWDHHALLIGLCLEHIAHLEAAVAKLDESVDALFAANQSEAGVPFAQAGDRLDTLTGIGKAGGRVHFSADGSSTFRFYCFRSRRRRLPASKASRTA